MPTNQQLHDQEIDRALLLAIQHGTTSCDPTVFARQQELLREHVVAMGGSSTRGRSRIMVASDFLALATEARKAAERPVMTSREFLREIQATPPAQSSRQQRPISSAEAERRRSQDAAAQRRRQQRRDERAAARPVNQPVQFEAIVPSQEDVALHAQFREIQGRVSERLMQQMAVPEPVASGTPYYGRDALLRPINEDAVGAQYYLDPDTTTVLALPPGSDMTVGPRLVPWDMRNHPRIVGADGREFVYNPQTQRVTSSAVQMTIREFDANGRLVERISQGITQVVGFNEAVIEHQLDNPGQGEPEIPPLAPAARDWSPADEDPEPEMPLAAEVQHPVPAERPKRRLLLPD